MQPRGAAWYGRLSTKDKQDPTLSFPTQLAACEEKAQNLGAEITAQFTDQESGRRDDREGWAALIAEARDRANRRFDVVIAYNTSRLGRDVFHAIAAERELSRLSVEVHYTLDAGDPTTPEGMLIRRMFQALDQYEVEKLGRETKRGLRENARQGYVNGGRPPYGYRFDAVVHPDPRRAAAGDKKQRLVPHEEEASVVREIFDLYLAGRGLGQIADHLNRPGGPRPPMHTDPSRNTTKRWSKPTIHYILRNPAYSGRLIWNVRDYRDQKLGQGPVRVRPEEEWVTSDHRHEEIVSLDSFQRVQTEIGRRKRVEGSSRRRSEQKRLYAYRGHVRCATGHNALNMFGKVVKGHTYYACAYARAYGAEAAAAAGHAGTELVREDVLHDATLDFFTREIFGPDRLAILRDQHKALERELSPRHNTERKRLDRALADVRRRIEAQVIAIEAGFDPLLAQQRVEALRKQEAEFQVALNELDSAESTMFDIAEACDVLSGIPDLSSALREAPPELLRKVFDAFRLSLDIDRGGGQLTVRAFVSTALAAVENLEGLAQISSEKPIPSVSNSEVAGAGFEPATSGL